MDQLATIWGGLPGWLREGVARAPALPYPALHVIAGVIAMALLSRSLAAFLLSWNACAASLIATAVSFTAIGSPAQIIRAERTEGFEIRLLP